MRAIKITKRFPARNRNYDPGLYLVPEDISALEAKLAQSDGYGEEATDQKEVDHAVQEFRKRTVAARKGPSPENKLAGGDGSAPENKQEVDGSPAGSGGGAGAKPGGARTLTTQTATGKPGAKPADNRGK